MGGGSGEVERDEIRRTDRSHVIKPTSLIIHVRTHKHRHRHRRTTGQDQQPSMPHLPDDAPLAGLPPPPRKNDKKTTKPSAYNRAGLSKSTWSSLVAQYLFWQL